MDKISSNKSFGILFFIVFSLISLWPLIFSSGELRIWPIPFAIIFIQQGLSKLPLNIEDAEAFNLPMTVWFFVAYGEIFSGIGDSLK